MLSSKESPEYFQRFYFRRLFRIFPIYYAYLILYFHVAVPLANAGVGDIREAWYWFYLSNWKAGAQQPIMMVHFWSLCIEEQFYLVWPLIVKISSQTTLKRICIALVIGAPLLRFASAFGVPSDIVTHATPFRIDTLALGALLAISRRDARLHNILKSLIPAMFLLIPLVLMGTIMLVRAPLPPSANMWFYSAIALTCALFVLRVVDVLGTGSPLAGALRTRLLRQFGKYSYGLYVWHPLVLYMVSALIRVLRYPPGTRFDWTLFAGSLLVGIAGSYGIALVSWRLIEEPCARLKERVTAQSSLRALPEEMNSKSLFPVDTDGAPAASGRITSTTRPAQNAQLPPRQRVPGGS